MDRLASDLVQLGTKTLAGMTPGETAYIDAVRAAPKERVRLLELGLVPGTALKAIRRAPLGDPLEVELRGYRLSLGKDEARHVRLKATRGAQELAAELRLTRVAREPSGKRRIALLGNPNTGKSTLFSRLSGRHVATGNYPGITVSRTATEIGIGTLVDLPGCYSLLGRSLDEDAAATELLDPRFGCDALIVVLDATALERSLYLLIQALELALPIVCALNMSDEARALGVRIDVDALAQTLGVPIVETVATKGVGLEALLREAERALSAREVSRVEHTGALAAHTKPSWHVAAVDTGKVQDETVRLEGEPGSVAAAFVSARYAFIDALCARAVQRPLATATRLSDHIDRVLTHPVLGTLGLLLLLGLCFTLLFSLSQPVMDAIEAGFGWLQAGARGLLPAGWPSELIVEGVIGGTGTVLVFLPQIALLLFLMSTLEAAGYLSRAAFLVDRLMRAVGLNGKAFVPMLSGYACAVPAILSLKTLENQRDRLLTMSVIPLMSCSARLPIYTLILATLFPAGVRFLGVPVSALVLLFMYVCSAVMAMLAASVLARTRHFSGMSPPLVLELPPYRMPRWRSVLRTVIARTFDFLSTAGSTIVVLSCVLWLLLHFPRAPEGAPRSQQLEHSIAGRIGHAIEPALEPLGFDWKIGIGLIGSFAAREVFVATMGVIYGSEEASLAHTLGQAKRADGTQVYSVRTGISLMFFFMLACQCMSTLAVIRRETRSWRWPVFIFSYMSALAYGVSLAINQLGRLL